MIMRVRSSSVVAPILAIWMKAVNSVRISLTPSRPPAVPASFQGTPIDQARGEKTTPRPRAMLSGWPPTIGMAPRTLSTIVARATKTIRVAPTFSAICRPSVVPFMTASIEEP